MFNMWKRVDELSLTVKSLWIVIIVLAVLNSVAFIGLANAPSKIRIFLPPNISAGGTFSQNNIPKSSVYGFAFQIFTALNSWPNGGDNDYLKNINNYHYYMTRAFHQALMANYTSLSNNGSLSRQRIMSLYGIGYKPSEVISLGNNTWRVNMSVQIIETVNSGIVKNVAISYPLIVKRERTSIAVNPWGLVIAGYADEPTRIQTLDTPGTKKADQVDSGGLDDGKI